jgi:prefoldin subunit 5
MTEEERLFKPNQMDPQLSERLETFRKYASAEVEKCDELIHEQEKEIDEYKRARNKVVNFPKVLRREDWLPINDYAFIRGTYDNTNKFYTLLGSQYFAERSAAQTVQFIERRIKAINDIKEGYEKQKELAKSRLEFAEGLFEQEKSDVVEIREPYDEETLRVKKQPKEDINSKDFEAVMSRLDELEQIEIQNNEIDDEEDKKQKPHIESKEDASKVVAPKGVSVEEFEKLMKHVDEMIESSDEEDYEDEDMSEEDENVIDSDDSLPESLAQKDEKKEVESKPLLEGKSSTTKKKSIRFSSNLEAGPTIKSSEEPSVIPKPILRNKNEKTLVDETAVKAMNQIEPERKILPATDAFKGVFVERNPHSSEPSTSTSTAADTKKPVSKFKAKRMQI